MASPGDNDQILLYSYDAFASFPPFVSSSLGANYFDGQTGGNLRHSAKVPCGRSSPVLLACRYIHMLRYVRAAYCYFNADNMQLCGTEASEVFSN